MKKKVRVFLKNHLDSIQRLSFFILFIGFAIGALAQNKITGIVTDTSGEPVIGASVVVKGTTNGSITDLNGNFAILNAPQNTSLVVSYIGYVSQTISVNGRHELKISLIEDKKTLEEVVVVGYGVQKKSDVTGALTRIGQTELNAMPVKDALQAMQGKTAGVDITTNQRPGETGGISIRGVRSLNADQGPLYVIDGMIIQNGGIENRLTRQSPWQGLTKHQRYPIEKERNVPYPTQLASKSLQLGIERFCRCVGSARNEVIEYFVLVGLNGVSDSLYFSQCGFRNLVIPFVEPCPGRVFCKTLALEYAP